VSASDTDGAHVHGTPARRPRWPWWIAGALILLLALGAVLPQLFEGQVRSSIEAQMNARLDGYSVTLSAIDLHVFGLSLTLRDLTVVQDAHPDPPVAHVPALHTSVQWQQVLRGRLVADFLFDGPELYLNLEQLREELDADVPVEDRGWREALEAAHFLEFNLVRVRNGELIYLDEDPDRPLHADRIDFVAADIRASPGPDKPYPSPFQLDAVVFGQGNVTISGHADFFAEPQPALNVRFDVEDVPLEHFRPVLARAGLIVTDGLLDGSGIAELAPDINRLHIVELRGHGMHVDYIHTGDNDDAAGEANDDDNDVDASNGNDDNDDADETDNDAAEAIAAVTEGPDPDQLDLQIDHLSLTGEFGLVNETQDPSWRVFLEDVTLTMTNYSNHFLAGPADVEFHGRFMGSGRTRGSATFRPEHHGPDFDLSVEIRDTHLPAMNDMLRAYGNFDVVDGTFSFFTELTIQDGHVEGYLRPLFGDMEVHDARQDEDKGLIQQLYEMAVGAIAGILENVPREEVATHAEISGPLDDPEMSTWEVIGGLLRNAFFQAILPGFEDGVSQ
jgi:hypothetical protein